MRSAVRVRMTSEQYLALKELLGQRNEEPIAELLKQLNEEFSGSDEATGKLIEEARTTHGSDDIEFDDDAPLSQTDDGCWVGSWCFVRNLEDKQQ